MRASSLPTVRVNTRGAKRLRRGHPWVYRSDLVDTGQAAKGDVVRVQVKHRTGGTNPLGTAFFNPESLITLRAIDPGTEIPDEDFWKTRLESALALREAWSGEGTGCRLVHAEADCIPGLVVDRYADLLVIQTLCAGTERLKDLFVRHLQDRLAPVAIVERNDTPVRKLEGLEERSGVLSGRVEGPIEMRQGSLVLPVDPLKGQKTGTFLDQRENQLCASGYARGECLDVFCYQGGFGLQLKKGGARNVTLVDQSDQALEMALEAGRRNDLELNVCKDNAFDYLREQQRSGARYDVVVLDPPAFAKNRAAVEGAKRGYKEINLRAMQLLVEGGILITSSCSYHMPPELFERIIEEAGRDAGRVVQILERRGQSRDHPERIGFPESRYLKCFVLRIR